MKGLRLPKELPPWREVVANAERESWFPLCFDRGIAAHAAAMDELMAAGEVDRPAVKRGVDFLVNAPREPDGRWVEPWYTAVGFPRVFYLKYHGYAAIFPLWALARYRELSASNTKRVRSGM